MEARLRFAWDSDYLYVLVEQTAPAARVHEAPDVAAFSNAHWDWDSAALNFDLGDSSMIYASVATGYKAGGNNARPFFPSQLNAFDPETIDSIEVGFKSTFGGNVRFNAAVAWASFEIPPNSGPRYRAGLAFVDADAPAVDAFCIRHRQH